MLRRFSAALLLAAPIVGQAAIPQGMELPACAYRYAKQYQVDVRLIQAIRIGEGGKVGQSVCGNKNQTCDHGPMQINDGWFDGRWGVSLPRDFGISKESVLNNECQNVRVGMWVLMTAYSSLKNWFEAVAAYNAGLSNRKYGYEYAKRVFRHYNKLVALPGDPRIDVPAKPIVVAKLDKPKSATEASSPTPSREQEKSTVVVTNSEPIVADIKKVRRAVHISGT